MDFSAFDKTVDLEGLKQDVANAQSGVTDYEEVPVGDYEVKIEKLELGVSKKGAPMLKVMFRILNGQYEKNCLFMNQVVTKGFQIHIANEFLRSLDTGVEVIFESYQQYDQMIMDIAEKTSELEYAINYSKDKDFAVYRVTEVFDKE